MALFKTKNLTKKYKSGDSFIFPIKKLNLEVDEGEFLMIFGPSGSGKTTLLYLLSTLERPDEGKLYYKGENLVELEEDDLFYLRRNEFGFVFQTFNLIPTLTSYENVLLPRMPEGISEEDKRKAKQLLKEVGLKDRINHKPAHLSGGEKQRVAIARALINNPSVVFADEPTGNLDSTTGKKIMELFKRINSKGVTVIMVTHNELLKKYADRVIYIKDGGIYHEE